MQQKTNKANDHVSAENKQRVSETNFSKSEWNLSFFKIEFTPPF